LRVDANNFHLDVLLTTCPLKGSVGRTTDDHRALSGDAVLAAEHISSSDDLAYRRAVERRLGFYELDR
jgi:hypothetical protein